MTEKETKFETLIMEMKRLLLNEVSAAKDRLTIIRNQEELMGGSYQEERVAEEIKVDNLRKKYEKILNDLKEIDQQKAIKEIVEIIRLKKHIEYKYNKPRKASWQNWIDHASGRKLRNF